MSRYSDRPGNVHMQRPHGSESNTYRIANACTAVNIQRGEEGEEGRMKLKHEVQPVLGLTGPLRMGVSIFSARS